MVKYQVVFEKRAEGEMAELMAARPELAGLALRHAVELAYFPLAKWVDMHWRKGEEVFKSDNHIVLDIQGIVHEAQKMVVITRFRLRHRT